MLLQPLQLGVVLFPGSALRSAALASRGDPSSAWLTPGSRLATAWKPCSLLACSSARPSASQDPRTTLKVREAAGLGGGAEPFQRLGPQGAAAVQPAQPALGSSCGLRLLGADLMLSPVVHGQTSAL